MLHLFKYIRIKKMCNTIECVVRLEWKREKITLMTISSRVTNSFWMTGSLVIFKFFFHDTSSSFFFQFFQVITLYTTWKLSWASEKHKRHRIYLWKKERNSSRLTDAENSFAKCFFFFLSSRLFFFSPFPLGIWPCFPVFVSVIVTRFTMNNGRNC